MLPNTHVKRVNSKLEMNLKFFFFYQLFSTILYRTTLGSGIISRQRPKLCCNPFFLFDSAWLGPKCFVCVITSCNVCVKLEWAGFTTTGITYTASHIHCSPVRDETRGKISLRLPCAHRCKGLRMPCSQGYIIVSYLWPQGYPWTHTKTSMFHLHPIHVSLRIPCFVPS